MPRIMIIHPEGNIANNPNLYGIVEILCEQGYEIDYFCRHRPHVSQQLPIPRARFFPITLHDAKDTAVILPPNFQVTLNLEDKLTKTLSGYDLLIGIDRGIIEAAKIASMLNIPFGLISYELYFAEETGTAYKLPEIEACIGISFAVCQDCLRSHHLSIENRIDTDKIINIPVAGRGTVRCTANQEFKKILGLRDHTRIALYMGEVMSKWAGIDELLTSTKNWDKTWVLVLHHRYGAPLPDTYAKTIQRGKVFSSPLGSLPFSEMYRLLSAVDLGIAFYLPQPGHSPYSEGLNLDNVGMASGKIATYLQHGLPLLTNEIGEMSRHIRKEQLGAVVDDIKTSAHALSHLTPDTLSDMRRNCLQFFDQHLDLNETVKPLLDVIKRIFRHELTSRKLFANAIGGTTGLRSVTKLPKISIVTPSYNQAEYLEECIDSVLSQNYPKLEYIIMDGGSTDGSVEIIKKYEKYLTYWQSKPDDGQYAAINEGFRHSSGEIMAWLNSDDKYHPGALHLVELAFSAMPQTKWVTGRPTAWDAQGKISIVFDHVPAWSPQRLLNHEANDFYIQQESTFWRRSLWDRAGGKLDTTWQFAADFELWCRFFRHAKLVGVDALLGGFRYHKAQKTATYMDRYKQEVCDIIAKESALFVPGAVPCKPPRIIGMDEIIVTTNPMLTPQVFCYFSYSRHPHFNWFEASATKLFGTRIDPDYCDLKIYQDLLCYTFIIDNVPMGSRILDIGGGDSRVLNALKHSYECWCVDKLEGLGNGLTELTPDGYSLVRAYLGEFSNELPHEYFDFVFSISALEHVHESAENFENICRDMDRVMLPGAYSLHCFDVVLKLESTWTNQLLPYMYRRYPTINRFTPFEQMCRDPFLYCMSENAYNRGWINITKLSYHNFGRPLSCNILWQKPILTSTKPLTISEAC